MKSKIVFFGNSITAGNKAPHLPLGEGFVAMLADKLISNETYRHIQVINSGINGHTVQDLLARSDRDAIQHVPDLLVIMIGINDAYNDFAAGIESGRLHAYESDYLKLIDKIITELPETDIALITPYYISDHGSEELYRIMSRYIGTVKQLGQTHDLPVLDVQRIFDLATRNKPAQYWANDQIHPIPAGHMLIAESVFKFLKDLF